MSNAELVKFQQALTAEVLVKNIFHKKDVLASRLTTMAVGGSIKNFFEVNNTEELFSLIDLLKKNDCPYQIIGAGSNLIFPDIEFSLPVIKLGRGFRNWQRISEAQVEVFAAMPIMNLAREVAQLGLSGLEFAAGIPASLGGAVAMNAGAHHGEFSQVIKSVTVLDASARITKIWAKDLEFAYRQTSLPAGSIVISAVLELQQSEAAAIQDKMFSCLNYRKATQPLTQASAGSIFRNPELVGEQLYAGALIEECGLKGFVQGAAQISEKHANWIVNPKKQASAKDVKDLIALCQEKVLERHGIELKTEVKIL